MARTYQDLAAQPRYSDAIAFFLSDLYGATDFAQRDSDLARVVPIMTRMLPGRVLTTIAEATELNALSQELDQALLSRLPRADGVFTVAEYCVAYRWLPERATRERQIGLIKTIGTGLDDYVKRPLIQSALTMMRQPARMAGLSALHDFLERDSRRSGRCGVPPSSSRPSTSASASSWLRSSMVAMRRFRNRRCLLREAWAGPFGLHDSGARRTLPSLQGRALHARLQARTRGSVTWACRNTCRIACALPLRSSA
jgi:hypothetical protein